MKLTLRSRWLAAAAIIIMGVSAQAQTIQLTQIPNASRCTGDSLAINILLTGSFSPANSFDVFLTPGIGAAANFSTPPARQVPIVKWTPNTNLPVNDTNDAGIKTMTIIIPEDIQVNGDYSIRMVGSNPIVVSDTFEVSVAVTTPASIDSSFGGFDNVYTPGDTSDIGKCVGDTVFLYANKDTTGLGIYNYQWFVGGIEVGTAQMRNDDNFDSLMVWIPGSYTVEVSAGLCPGLSDEQIVNDYIPTSFIIMPLNQPWVEILDVPFPGTPLVDSVQFCEEDSILYYGLPAALPGEFYTYQWYKDSVNQFGLDSVVPIQGQTNDTIYITSDIVAGGITPNQLVIYLEVTDTMTGCSTFGQDPRWIWMDTVPDPEISAIPWPGNTGVSTTICIEDSVLLRADTVGADWEYQWQVRFPLNGGTWASIPNDTLPSLQVDTALIPDSAEYRLIINNFTCTHITQPIQVNIVPLPTFRFLPSDSVAICADDSVLVAVTGNGLQYTWSNGFIGTSQYVSLPGTYWVEAVGVNQCVTYDTLIIFPLVVNANAGPDQTIGQDEDVVMTASGGVTYYWYANEPVYFSNPRDPNTRTRPVKDTTWYFVEVTAANGCVGIDSMLVIVQDPFAGGPNLSNVQNMMTPNGDGANDVLDLSEVIRADGCDLIVMNRWGSEVYMEENYSNGWAGTSTGGDDLPDGTYYYILVCGDEVRYKGAITIIRNND